MFPQELPSVNETELKNSKLLASVEAFKVDLQIELTICNIEQTKGA